MSEEMATVTIVGATYMPPQVTILYRDRDGQVSTATGSPDVGVAIPAGSTLLHAHYGALSEKEITLDWAEHQLREYEIRDQIAAMNAPNGSRCEHGTIGNHWPLCPRAD